MSNKSTLSRKFESTLDSTFLSRGLSIPPKTSNQSTSLEGCSVWARLHLESGAGNHDNSRKNSTVDLPSYGLSTDSLKSSALLSRGIITTKRGYRVGHKWKAVPKRISLQMTESNSKSVGFHRQRAPIMCQL